MDKHDDRQNLVVLAADKTMQQVLQALLRRSDALQTRAFTFEVFAHPQNDAGVRTQSVPFLRPLHQNYHCAVVIFDHDGSGAENTPAIDLEKEVENDLDRSGWQDRNCVVVLEPELESWVWSSSPNVDHILGWGNHIPPLRNWLVERQFSSAPSEKPERPKEAMQAAMAFSGKRWSSAVHRELAAMVRFSDCTDRSFLKLRKSLKNWFPA